MKLAGVNWRTTRASAAHASQAGNARPMNVAAATVSSRSVVAIAGAPAVIGMWKACSAAGVGVSLAPSWPRMAYRSAAGSMAAARRATATSARGRRIGGAELLRIRAQIDAPNIAKKITE